MLGTVPRCCSSAMWRTVRTYLARYTAGKTMQSVGQPPRLSTVPLLRARLSCFSLLLLNESQRAPSPSPLGFPPPRSAWPLLGRLECLTHTDWLNRGHSSRVLASCFFLCLPLHPGNSTVIQLQSISSLHHAVPYPADTCHLGGEAI